jgi:hypothetical protein
VVPGKPVLGWGILIWASRGGILGRVWQVAWGDKTRVFRAREDHGSIHDHGTTAAVNLVSTGDGSSMASMARGPPCTHIKAIRSRTDLPIASQ